MKRRTQFSVILTILVFLLLLSSPALCEPNQLTAYVAGTTDRSASFTVLPGETLILSVDTTGDNGELSFSWKIGRRTTDHGVITLWTDYTFEEIAGKTTNSIETGPVTERVEYICTVRDSSGSSVDVSFYITVDSGLAAITSGYNEIWVKPGDTAKLTAEARVNSGNLHYQWSYAIYDDIDLVEGDTIEGANASSVNTHPVNRPAWYYCLISDDYGNSTIAQFHVRADSGLKLYGWFVDDVDIISPGDTLTLKADATVEYGDVLLYWEEFVSSSYTLQSTREGGDTWVIENIQQYTEVYCYAYDDYGNSQYRYWRVSIDNNLKVEPVGEPVRYVRPGDQIRLEVNASADEGELKYSWDSEFENPITIDDNGSFAIIDLTGMERNEFIYCTVEDMFGTTETVVFQLMLDEGGEPIQISMNQPAIVNDTTTFEFTPAQTGRYTFSVDAGECVEIMLMDKEGGLIAGPFESGLSDIYLGDNVYYTIEAGVQFTHSLHGGSSYRIYIYDTIKDRAVLTVKFVGTEHTSGLNIITLPDDLTRIESEAFANVRKTDAVRIPESVTYISPSAFAGTSPIIITTQGSYAEKFANQYGMEVILE